MGTVRLPAQPSGQGPTISAFAHGLDAQRYVCPAVVQRRIAQLLDPAGALLVLAVTGAGGLGKSAALREAARCATDDGHTVISIDGRRADAAELIGELSNLPGGRTLVAIDEADQFGAGLHALGRALGDLPATTRVILAAHHLPPGWLPEHLEPLAGRLRLAALAAKDADALLLGYGVADPAARESVASWAAGLPLALVLGAGAWATSRGAAGPAFTLPRETEHDLVDRIVGPALAQLDPDLLAVAALAGGVDVRLLAEVLPDSDAEAGLARLQECTFVERMGARLLLHPRLAEAIAVRMREADPTRAEALTLRIAAHLRDRAVAGEHVLPWLAGLVHDPALRAGLAPPVSAELYVDRVRPGDAAAIREVLDRRWPGTWSLVEPWLRTDVLHVVRRPDGGPAGVVATLPLARAVECDRACRTTIGPLLDHAQREGLTDRAVVTPFQIALEEGEPDPDLLRIRNAVALQRCGVANPRIDLVVEVTGSEAERSVLAAYGYQEIDGVRTSVASARGWVADVGPAGLAGLLYDAVAAEHGRPPLARAGGGDSLLRALEDFHSDVALAQLPEAPADLPVERAAERVRVWARDSLAALLADEPGLLGLVVQRYLEPGATHESVMRDQFASRATYFRRLRRARTILGGADDPAIRTIKSS